MQLSKLLPLAATLINPSEVDITHLTHSAWDAQRGSLFFCIEGTRTDGHNHAEVAIGAGAAALVVSKKLNIAVPQILVSDTRAAMSEIAARFYDNPSGKLKIAGITGTNGKTTTSYIVKSILEAAGYKAAAIGTNGVLVGNAVRPSLHTTPDPIELQSTFNRLVQEGVTHVVMEASAHAIHQRKLIGVYADVVAFSNLSQDHLDYFGTMERYGNVKASYFDKLYGKVAVVNIDDEWGRKIVERANLPVTTYGYANPADVFAVGFEQSAKGLSYVINLNDQVAPINFRLPGKFNMYNTLCAASIAGALGIGLEHIAQGIAALEKVDGRFDLIDGGNCLVVIDYAHTADGLKNVLSCIEEFCVGRIITVFGAGGDRDRTKRKDMGYAVASYSDVAILTSDNPRFEDSGQIMDDVAKGFEGGLCSLERIENRKDAIIHAIRIARGDDIVLVAGKGAEKYQEIKGKRYEFSDHSVVLEALGEEKT